MNLPPHVTVAKDRHGKTRYRFRRRRMPSRYLHGEPGSDVFNRMYEECISQERAPLLPKAKNRPAPSTASKPSRITHRALTIYAGRQHVYFIGSQSGAVKIGTSIDIRARLIKLQSAHPRRLSLLACIEGGADLEKSYHQRFSADRISGEWYRKSAELRGEIERLRALILSAKS